MKGSQIKILAILLTLIVYINLFFAQVSEGNAEVRNYLNNIFSSINKTYYFCTMVT